MTAGIELGFDPTPEQRRAIDSPLVA